MSRGGGLTGESPRYEFAAVSNLLNKYHSLKEKKEDFPATVDPSKYGAGKSPTQADTLYAAGEPEITKNLPKQPAEPGWNQPHHSQGRGPVREL